ncbi:hypothetical protein C8J57DRAFT_1215265 [Mycena rebaudengoi]|nr:hypothetical protein C8J57DRAFT_1215265 [Mycena rebaudengoi]
MLRRYILSHICLMALIISTHSSRISLRVLPVLPIDGLASQIPTTTDFPAPQTTDDNSDIADAYRLYLQECGQPMQDGLQIAIEEYKRDQNKDPDDPNSQDFSEWAYTHILNYQSHYRLCVDHESKYKNLLATFVPDKPTSTSALDGQATGGGKSTSSGSGSGDDGGKGQGSQGSNTGRVNSDVPKIMGIISGLLTAQMLLI